MYVSLHCTLMHHVIQKVVGCSSTVSQHCMSDPMSSHEPSSDSVAAECDSAAVPSQYQVVIEGEVYRQQIGASRWACWQRPELLGPQWGALLGLELPL